MPAQFNIHATPSWTEERIETLRKLWTEGLSASEISSRIAGFSRNAVIGKLHRLGLSAETRSKPHLAVGGRKAARIYKRKGREMRAAKASAARRVSAPVPRAETYVPPIMSETAPPNATPLLETRSDQCRWPYGDTDFVFCPEDHIPGSSYCAGHHVRVYTGVPAVKVRTH